MSEALSKHPLWKPVVAQSAGFLPGHKVACNPRLLPDVSVVVPAVSPSSLELVYHLNR